MNTDAKTWNAIKATVSVLKKSGASRERVAGVLSTEFGMTKHEVTSMLQAEFGSA